MTQTSQATKSQQIVLASRPEGAPSPSNFKMVSAEVVPIKDGEFLVKNHWMSVDPYMRGRMKGFIVRDHLDAQAEFIADMASLIKAEKIVWEETIADGLENSPSAFIGLFGGDNLGKQLVRIG